MLYAMQWAHDEGRRSVMAGLQAKRRGWGFNRPVTLSSFKQDAPWRNHPASDKQRKLLENLKVREGGRGMEGAECGCCCLPASQRSDTLAGMTGRRVPQVQSNTDCLLCK